MVIKKQQVISWLLETETNEYDNYQWVPTLDNKKSYDFLVDGMDFLKTIRNLKPNWGLPELVTKSFIEIMKKCSPSFVKIVHELFEEFCKEEECGILITEEYGTIVYGFGDEGLYIWLFSFYHGLSRIRWHLNVTVDTKNITSHTSSSISDEKQLFVREIERQQICHWLSSFIIYYLAVKKHGKVEIITAPINTITKLDDTLLNSKGQDIKVKNNSGQEVIIMDSRWLRKIINDNDIFVRGYFRLQRKKNAQHEWYKELIYINPTVRPGYHRNAKKEKCIGNNTQES